jgi:DNA-directed RNA polymerase subunit beta
MQKQSIPINKKEKPLIQTGTETKIATESSYLIRTKKEGVYKYHSKNKIIVKEKKESLINYNKQSFSILKKKKEKVKLKSDKIKENESYILRTYKLEDNLKTNQNLYIRQNLINKTGKLVKKGEILTNNSHINFGKLCLGKNLLIGYMPLEGYNFEDAIIINKKIIKEESLASMHIKKYLTFILDNEIGKVRK